MVQALTDIDDSRQGTARKARPGVDHDFTLATVEAPVSDARAEDARRSLLRERKYSIPETATMVGIGQTKMRQIIAKGEIPVLLLDGKRLLLEQDLEAFLQGRYGAVKAAKKGTKPKMPPLSRHIAESALLKKAG